MKVRAVRAVLLILGSVSVGYWLMMFTSPWTRRVLFPGVIRSMSDAERAMAIAPWPTGIPSFVAAGVAGLSLGYVTGRARTLPWAAGLIAVIGVWFYGLRLWHGSSIAGGIATSVAQLFVASVLAVVCLTLGRRLQRHEPVA